VIRRANHPTLLATKFAATFEERSDLLDDVDRAIAKIRSLLRRERNREQQQQSSLVERAKSA
jgi:ribosome-associated translation inhibitor RaiA